MRPGPGVDLVADVEALPQADGSVGTVLALSTFEHVPHFWRGMAEVQRVLRPDGALLPFLSQRLLAVHAGGPETVAGGLPEQDHRLARAAYAPGQCLGHRLPGGAAGDYRPRI
jgi:ubiquinone/menaquinone biosynthesis C-methylase UbiE